MTGIHVTHYFTNIIYIVHEIKVSPFLKVSEIIKEQS